MATNATRSTDFDVSDDNQLSEREVRALTQMMTTISTDSPGIYEVTTESGSEYTVDVRDGSCTCPDAMHRDVVCKHIHRARYAVGRKRVPDWVNRDAVDPQLGEHVEARQPVADGGTVADEGTDGGDLEDGRIYTYHYESYEQGGARYVRCEVCGAECVPANPDRLAHFEACPEGRR